MSDKRWIPCDLGLEKNVLSQMALDHNLAIIGVSRLLPSDFWLERHTKTFEAIRSIILEHGHVDFFSVISKLVASKYMDEERAQVFIMDLSEPGAMVNTFFDDYVAYLKALTLRRLAQAQSWKLMAAANNQSMENGDVVTLFQQASMDLAGQKVGEGLTSFEECTPAALDWLDDINRGLLPGIRTGMNKWDRFFGGMVGGDLIVLGARPSQGKTSLALAIAIETARGGHGVAFMTMEMKKRELMLRAYARERRLNLASFRNGMATFAERAFMAEAAESMRSLPIYFDESRRQSPLQIEAGVRALSQRRKIDLVVVDYLTMMRADGKHESRRHELSYCARAMKDMAGTLNIPVILLSQLNREMEKNGGREPTSSDLRETGEIEEAADVVGLIHRPHTYSVEADPKLAKIIATKVRNGPVGWFGMDFEATCAGFFDQADKPFLEGYSKPEFKQNAISN